MSTQRLNPSTHTTTVAAGTATSLYNIKGVYPHADGTLVYTDASGVEQSVPVVACNVPPLCAGNVSISASTDVTISVL